ncbi:hypothetical protein [Dermatophilus congolensis]|uniref:hypothetical protein n=1 Tax=Dermatophilus congolensis TaxID=1863 RepID=UPI001AAE7934|nr:hypothetical protein [Dermatophilus congolensis]MBO3143276.1 hypothetical protein [Dermatophilus congolensis]MBO3152263.1 hypothetical protein [Dermatophilus congolensis]MBO3160725.1 hypothetical protein [Dermatophilus congolensis]MBO3163551.1 hypothetical protein [Dermatophilus congolensis]MBO3177097.1 hypothetical protein [Dermatophilus congolensis]
MKSTSSFMRAARLRGGKAAAVIALGLAALGLAGCGTAGSPGVAAVANGTVISEKNIDDVMTDLTKAGAGAQIKRADIVQILALRPMVLEVGKKHGAVIGEDVIRAALAKQLPDVSQTTIQMQQVQAIGRKLGQNQGKQGGAINQELQKAFASADISVSPRYGGYDPKRGFLPAQPAWIQPAQQAMPQPR